MSSFTFADNKLGGRIQASCDAIAAGHLNRAAGILAELADELNVEATEAGLLSEEAEEDALAQPAPLPPVVESPALVTNTQPVDLQMCSRGVHLFGDPAPVTGWRTCRVCETVNVAPPDGGPIDMSARQ